MYDFNRLSSCELFSLARPIFFLSVTLYFLVCMLCISLTNTQEYRHSSTLDVERSQENGTIPNIIMKSHHDSVPFLVSNIKKGVKPLDVLRSSTIVKNTPSQNIFLSIDSISIPYFTSHLRSGFTFQNTKHATQDLQDNQQLKKQLSQKKKKANSSYEKSESPIITSLLKQNIKAIYSENLFNTSTGTEDEKIQKLYGWNDSDNMKSMQNVNNLKFKTLLFFPDMQSLKQNISMGKHLDFHHNQKSVLLLDPKQPQRFLTTERSTSVSSLNADNFIFNVSNVSLDVQGFERIHTPENISFIYESNQNPVLLPEPEGNQSNRKLLMSDESYQGQRAIYKATTFLSHGSPGFYFPVIFKRLIFNTSNETGSYPPKRNISKTYKLIQNEDEDGTTSYDISYLKQFNSSFDPEIYQIQEEKFLSKKKNFVPEQNKKAQVPEQHSEVAVNRNIRKPNTTVDFKLWFHINEGHYGRKKLGLSGFIKKINNSLENERENTTANDSRLKNFLRYSYVRGTQRSEKHISSKKPKKNPQNLDLLSELQHNLSKILHYQSSISGSHFKPALKDISKTINFNSKNGVMRTQNKSKLTKTNNSEIKNYHNLSNFSSSLAQHAKLEKSDMYFPNLSSSNLVQNAPFQKNSSLKRRKKVKNRKLVLPSAKTRDQRTVSDLKSPTLYTTNGVLNQDEMMFQLDKKVGSGELIKSLHNNWTTNTVDAVNQTAQQFQIFSFQDEKKNLVPDETNQTKVPKEIENSTSSELAEEVHTTDLFFGIIKENHKEINVINFLGNNNLTNGNNLFFQKLTTIISAENFKKNDLSDAERSKKQPMKHKIIVLFVLNVFLVTMIFIVIFFMVKKNKKVSSHVQDRSYIQHERKTEEDKIFGNEAFEHLLGNADEDNEIYTEQIIQWTTSVSPQESTTKSERKHSSHIIHKFLAKKLNFATGDASKTMESCSSPCNSLDEFRSDKNCKEDKMDENNSEELNEYSLINQEKNKNCVEDKTNDLLSKSLESLSDCIDGNVWTQFSTSNENLATPPLDCNPNHGLEFQSVAENTLITSQVPSVTEEPISLTTTALLTHFPTHTFVETSTLFSSPLSTSKCVSTDVHTQISPISTVNDISHSSQSDLKASSYVGGEKWQLSSASDMSSSNDSSSTMNISQPFSSSRDSLGQTDLEKMPPKPETVRSVSCDQNQSQKPSDEAFSESNFMDSETSSSQHQSINPYLQTFYHTKDEKCQCHLHTFEPGQFKDL